MWLLKSLRFLTVGHEHHSVAVLEIFLILCYIATWSCVDRWTLFSSPFLIVMWVIYSLWLLHVMLQWITQCVCVLYIFPSVFKVTFLEVGCVWTLLGIVGCLSRVSFLLAKYESPCSYTAPVELLQGPQRFSFLNCVFTLLVYFLKDC